MADEAAVVPDAPPPLDVSEERYEEIRQRIKDLASERERLVAEDADPKAVADVLKDISVLAAEGNNIARTLQAKREAEAKQQAQRAAQDGHDALARLEARYEEEKADLTANRRVAQ